MILTLFLALGWLGLGILRLDQILRGYHGLRSISSKTSFGRVRRSQKYLNIAQVMNL
ncbi:hypothetical protein DFH08DRAFT_727521 [Mycena albidolilacea]|uniref:Uncharacterized protein n=1 Tax=Mycena albidolilacea TaxID=1033008 RepID=A0AAD7F7H2_9AGAR|nr:hypothetical protein DFH08DRAFT_727521 [Mycena albidolilacea]